MMNDQGENYQAELQLLSPDRFVRLRALRKLVYSSDALYVLRNAIAADSDADVRTSAVNVLAEWRDTFCPSADGPDVTELLIEACSDSAPQTRQAALQALATLKETRAVPCGTIALQDQVWWVRRSAVELIAVQGNDAIDALLSALDDPFWRVRYTALLALTRLGRDTPELKARLAKPLSDDSEVRAAGLLYLRRRWSKESEQVLLTPNDPPMRHDEVWDPDPAVMAARLENPNCVVSAASLVELLADPHEHLRAGAVKHLQHLASPRAFWASLLWLDEPRIPYGHDTTAAMLNRLGAPARDLVHKILEEASPGPGAIRWALHWVAAAKSSEFRELVRGYTDHAISDIRQAAFQAMAQLRPTELDEPSIRKGLSDSHPIVRLRAAQSIASARSGVLDLLLDALPYKAQCVYMRRLLVQRACASDEVLLGQALGDDDVQCRATALHTLAISSLLPTSESVRGLQSADPWIRTAVLSRDSAIQLLEDNCPAVQRAAIDWLCLHASLGNRSAGLIAAQSPDEYLRSRASTLFAPPTDLQVLLTLAQDSSSSVRIAASERLSECMELDDHLRSLLQTSVAPMLRKAAYTFLCRSFDENASILVQEALAHETDPLVVEHLSAIGLGCGLHMGVPKPVVSETEEAVIRETPRDSHCRLGQTDIWLSPIIMSGAKSLSASALEKTRLQGVNSFFWEPKYRQLTQYLRTSPAPRSKLTLIAGTYELSASTIEADLNRTLRRLGTDYLDVFLLFWVRSPRRVDSSAFAAMSRLKASGKVRAIGFSTHHRDIAQTAIAADDWDVLMLRHSAAHVGAEREIFPAAQAAGVGVLSFSNLCYGRMLNRRVGHWTPTAADCYRYSLSRPGVSASICSPRTYEQAMEYVKALHRPTLSPDKVEAIRAHGAWVYGQNNDFKSLVRRTPREAVEKSNNKIDQLLGERRHEWT